MTSLVLILMSKLGSTKCLSLDSSQAQHTLNSLNQLKHSIRVTQLLRNILKKWLRNLTFLRKIENNCLPSKSRGFLSLPYRYTHEKSPVSKSNLNLRIHTVRNCRMKSKTTLCNKTSLPRNWRIYREQFGVMMIKLSLTPETSKIFPES